MTARSLTTWHFEVCLVHGKTGERRTAVVELSDDERRDVIRNRRVAECVINSHAGARARKILKADNFFNLDRVEPVVIH
jgi:hypothetical protein